MSTQERWDVVLVILSGPLRSPAEQVHRGPIVRIGHNPGPGGVRLSGYRGLDARQCTITAYANGTAQISPVGTNQVRIAPHAHVNWRDIDPINGPTFLSDGCAIHLGPVGRGASIQFVECRRLGVWQGGDMRSEVAGGGEGGALHGYGAGIGSGPIPTAYDARKVRRLGTGFAPAWFIGCFSLLSMSTVSTMLIGTVAVLYGQREVVDLTPSSDKYEYFEYVDIRKPPDAKLLKGLEQPMLHFVMQPNRLAAEGAHEDLQEAKNWDKTFMKYVTKSVEQHARQKRFWGNLDRKRVEWASVLKVLRKEKLPDVFAAIPYQESQYKANAQSFVCAKGYWQFMPETANRVDKYYQEEFRVRDCRLSGRSQPWSPSALTPPFTRNSPYVENNKCLITNCRIDDRTDLRKSTKAAAITLKEAWDHPEIRASGSAVQATILSHNAGADDGAYGKSKRSNVIPALRKWIGKNGARQSPKFYGDNILCQTNHGLDACGSVLMPETQHYAYNIVAQHILAVCYYSKNYGHTPEFESWSTWALPDSYCAQFKVPTSSEARGW